MDADRLPMPVPVSRREVVVGGLLAGCALALAGCASSSGSRTAAAPKWPDLKSPRPAPQTVPNAGPWTGDGVVPRAAWAKGQPIPSRMDPLGGRIERITVHHDGMRPVSISSYADVADRIDAIRRAHQGQNWGDIGYHYVVDPTGRVWEGRPLSWQGAHVKDQNRYNLGVLVLGNFEQQRPTPAQVAGLERFVASRMRMYRVDVRRVHTHRELASTACPGRNLQPMVERMRSRGGALAMV